MPSSIETPYEVGDTILVEWGNKLHDAKVLALGDGHDGQDVRVHYLRWSQKWDDWVRFEYTHHITAETRTEQARIAAEFNNGTAVTTDPPAKRTRHSLSAAEDDDAVSEVQRADSDVTEGEQRRPPAAESWLTMEHQYESLQQRHAAMVSSMAQLQQRLDAAETKVVEAAAKTADYKRLYEVATVEKKRLREENSEYSKRLLDVVRVASGAVGGARHK